MIVIQASIAVNCCYIKRPQVHASLSQAVTQQVRVSFCRRGCSFNTIQMKCFAELLSRWNHVHNHESTVSNFHPISLHGDTMSPGWPRKDVCLFGLMSGGAHDHESVRRSLQRLWLSQRVLVSCQQYKGSKSRSPGKSLYTFIKQSLTCCP